MGPTSKGGGYRKGGGGKREGREGEEGEGTPCVSLNFS